MPGERERLTIRLHRDAEQAAIDRHPRGHAPALAPCEGVGLQSASQLLQACRAPVPEFAHGIQRRPFMSNNSWIISLAVEMIWEEAW